MERQRLATKLKWTDIEVFDLVFIRAFKAGLNDFREFKQDWVWHSFSSYATHIRMGRNVCVSVVP